MKRAEQDRPEPRWVASTEQLGDCLAEFDGGPLAVDSESDSLHHYPEKVCLVQLSTPQADLLVDPLAGVDLPAVLGPLLADPGRRKILHGADYDLRVLDRDFGLRIRGLFDTMVAARLIGQRAFGLGALLEEFFGHTVDKRFQRADWSLRPLTDEMSRYAVEDTCHLAPLAEILEERLEQLGRLDWAREEFERLEEIRYTPPAPDGFLRTRGSVGLDRRGLAVLRELHALRESVARERDRPPFKILGDDTLVGLADRRPTDARGLNRTARLGRYWMRPRAGQRLLEAVQRGMEVADGDLPERPRGRRPARDREFDARVKQLGRQRDEIAAKLDLESSVIAPRAVLEQVLTRHEAGEDWSTVPALRRWQAELIAPLLDTRLSSGPGVP